MCCGINLFINPEVKTQAIKVICFKHIINLLKDMLMRSMVTIDSNDLSSNDFFKYTRSVFKFIFKSPSATQVDQFL